MRARPRCLIGPAPGWLEPPTVAQRSPRILREVLQHERCPEPIREVSQPTALGLAPAVDLVIALCATPDCSDRSAQMEDLGLQALQRRAAGIDVHRMKCVVTALIEQPDGTMQRTTRECGGFKPDAGVLAEWLKEIQVEPVVMESTGAIEVRYRGRVSRASQSPILELSLHPGFDARKTCACCRMMNSSAQAAKLS